MLLFIVINVIKCVIKVHHDDTLQTLHMTLVTRSHKFWSGFVITGISNVINILYLSFEVSHTSNFDWQFRTISFGTLGIEIVALLFANEVQNIICTNAHFR